jgi:hypothetical protein
MTFNLAIRRTEQVVNGTEAAPSQGKSDPFRREPNFPLKLLH